VNDELIQNGNPFVKGKANKVQSRKYIAVVWNECGNLESAA
jgi:hypothetical protein